MRILGKGLMGKETTLFASTNTSSAGRDLLGNQVRNRSTERPSHWNTMCRPVCDKKSAWYMKRSGR